jgi:orotidine-5'-phosphate decarboxylase
VNASERLIVALDRPSTEENVALVGRLRGRASFFKVGMAAFYADAERVIGAVRDAGGSLFLDLKLYDIPATVEGAVRSLARWSPELLTVHASGGHRMVDAAVRAAAVSTPGTRVVGVTVLTSFAQDEATELGWGSIPQTAERWARVARGAGAHGWVCSAEEVGRLRAIDADAVLVVPGIRRAGDVAGDQRRVQGPKEAVDAGASYLVVGRPIHGASDPVAAWEAYAAALADA